MSADTAVLLILGVLGAAEFWRLVGGLLRRRQADAMDDATIGKLEAEKYEGLSKTINLLSTASGAIASQLATRIEQLEAEVAGLRASDARCREREAVWQAKVDTLQATVDAINRRDP